MHHVSLKHWQLSPSLRLIPAPCLKLELGKFCQNNGKEETRRYDTIQKQTNKRKTLKALCFADHRIIHAG
ncbi:unnamed protein product [Litomosoides sigmodontis]|uniref:Uncharacterized protein n=1 Tax=Litomosoides sigmodontis TaxID=42156 RepID=A0A3P6V4U5_LITSI|nr:unnamed protein product [Litomosoides sigmodontis]